MVLAPQYLWTHISSVTWESGTQCLYSWFRFKVAKQNKDEMSACFMNRLYYYTANICFSIWSKIIFQLLLLSLNIECVGAGASGGGGAVYDVRTNFNIHVNGWARRQQQALWQGTLSHLVKVRVWAARQCATYHGANMSFKLWNLNVEMDQMKWMFVLAAILTSYPEGSSLRDK